MARRAYRRRSDRPRRRSRRGQEIIVSNSGIQRRIIGGPLAGMTGTVLRKYDRGRHVMHVEFVHRGASIEIDGAITEAI